MQLVLILVLLSSCLANALSNEKIEQEWLSFNQKYGKMYRNIEETNKSFNNFKENLEKIYEHNKLFEQKLVTYKMAVNPYADMSLQEMEYFYMGLKMSEIEELRFPKNVVHRTPTRHTTTLPTFMDWRERGAVTPVKNQLACGSCWAFSSTGALESHHFLKHNKSLQLSEQNLVDCVKENAGCQGGWMIPALEYVQENGGINDEAKYPYEAVDGKCRFRSKRVAATCNGYSLIRQDDEQHLLEVVATKGPVVVAVDVNVNFLYYVDGVYDDPTCTQMVNHAVLVVGYGTESGRDYWLVKNSWGIEWGDKGYIKMARNKNNQCAIATYGLYPLV